LSDAPPENRTVLVLIADDHAAERLPTLTRYLQIGLIDEPIRPLLVAPDESRAIALHDGPTPLLTYRTAHWPMSRWNHRALVQQVRQRVETTRHRAGVVVHGLDLHSAGLAAEIAMAVGGELVLNVNASFEVRDHHFAAAIAQAACLVAPTHAIADAIRDGALLSKPVEVIPAGVVATNAPAAFQDEDKSPSLVYAGPLVEGCGLDTLFGALKSVLARHPNPMLLVIGKGPAEQNLRHLAEKLDIYMNVTFTGRLGHWRMAMEAGDVFCLTDPTRMFREEVVYAMGAGMVIIGAEGAAFDGLVDGQTALLYPAYHELELADRILRVLESRDTARRIAAAAQCEARSNHSVSRMVSEYVHLYKRLARKHQTLPISGAR